MCFFNSHETHLYIEWDRTETSADSLHLQLTLNFTHVSCCMFNLQLSPPPLQRVLMSKLKI